MDTPKNIIGGACRESSIKKHYPEFYSYLLSNYPQDISFQEKMYWYKTGITSPPTCPVCGKQLKFINSNVGYQQYCSPKCSNSSPEKQKRTIETNMNRYGGVAPICSKVVANKMKQTCLEKYGVENISQSKEHYEKNIQTRIERYGGCGNASAVSQEKYKRTCLEKYGVENPMQNETVQKKFADNYIQKYGVKSPFLLESVRQKSIQTCIKRYGKSHFNNADTIKSTMRERCGNDISSPTQLLDVLDKIYATKLKNGTFNSSNIERDFEHYLKINNVTYITQYKSAIYPFNCDFYIPEYELYIEIQASWTHGGHPYDEILDEKQLESWQEKSKHSKFYQNAIKTWTIRDVNKRNVAQQNNLRYLEIFTNDINTAIKQYERFVSKLH